MTDSTHKLIHDVRNPLNNISVNAELGKLILTRTGDIDKAKDIFTTILEECRKCSDKLEELKEKTDHQL